MESTGRGVLFFCSLVCSFHLYLWSDTFPTNTPLKKKKVPSPLKPYTANGFHLSHNNPDNMRNCTKFILSLCPCSLFFGFPSTKWKSYPNAFEKKKKYIGRYSKLGERSQRFHKEKIKTNWATSRIQQTIWGPHTDQTHFIQHHSNFRLICLFWGAQVQVLGSPACCVVVQNKSKAAKKCWCFAETFQLH